MKYLRASLLFITLLTLIYWGQILSQTFLGESFHYFKPESLEGDLFQYDNFARFFFILSAKILKDNIFIYQAIELITFIIFNICIFITFAKISKSQFLGLIASLLVFTSFFGYFELIAIGNYQRFIQRIPELLLLFPSIYYLLKSTIISNNRNNIISLVLYSLSLFLGHYTSFFLPIFFLLPIVRIIVKRKLIIRNLVNSLCFLLITLFLTSLDKHNPHLSVFTFLRNESDLINKVLVQVSGVGLPSYIFTSYQKMPLLKLAPIDFRVYLGILLILFFLYLGKNSKNKIVYFTMLLSAPLIAFLNLYGYQGGISILTEPTYSRLYFPLLIPISYLWADILDRWIKINSLIRILVIMGVVFTLITNFLLIRENIDRDYYKHIAMNKFISTFRDKKSEIFTVKSPVLLIPSAFQWPLPMFAKIYNHEVTYASFDSGWEEQIKGINKNNVFVFDYDYEDMGSGNQGTVIDKTYKFRNGDRIFPNKK